MKKFLFASVLFLMLSAASFAQTVKYHYSVRDDMAAANCHVEYGIYKAGENYSIVVLLTSEKLHFMPEVSLWIKTFCNEFIRLKGFSIAGTMRPEEGDERLSTIAQFPITKEQLELLNNGVSKLRLSAFPKEHEKVFRKDEIGKPLYNLYVDLKKAYDAF